ncbi:putative disease resistance protein [Trifolium repens]|nr:putative disease resistance protein [Trifolium repens]
MLIIATLSPSLPYMLNSSTKDVVGNLFKGFQLTPPSSLAQMSCFNPNVSFCFARNSNFSSNSLILDSNGLVKDEKKSNKRNYEPPT